MGTQGDSAVGITVCDGFGTLLRRHRCASGLTQEELAGRAGLSVRAVADMERGRTARPYRGSVRLLADALALSSADRELFASYSRRPRAETVAAHGPHADGTPPGKSPVTVVPRQLPPVISHFAGRSADLKTLDGLLDTAPGTHWPAGVAVITGPAGVGKTALAVRWAQLVADRFPDGHLHVDLQGSGASGKPVSPAAAIRGFLEALGVAPSQIPVSGQAQAGMYRSLLARRSMLVLADDAADAAQVRPLLPGSPACLVLVTSRSQLTGLVAAEGAAPLSLDLLTEPEAAEMLTRMLGPERMAAEPRAVTDLIGLCAGLPLALAIVAGQAATSPRLALGALAAELREAPCLPDAIGTGDPVTSLRAVFASACERLTGPARQLFGLLGSTPDRETTAIAAAGLAGVPVGEAAALLRELAGMSLLAEEPAGAFRFAHPLLRAYAGGVERGGEGLVSR